MPFTISHPAIILPLYKKLNKYFNLTGLVLGSMAPDFEYFINFRPYGTMGHTLLGFFYFNLPLCFLIAYIFHFIVKRPLILNMISPIDKWFYNYAYSKWNLKSFKEIAIFVYSSLVGMISHVLWDSFTHNNSFFVNKFSILNIYIKISNFNIPVYKFLQHGSTILGFIVLLLCLRNIRSNTKIESYLVKRKFVYSIRILIITFVVVIYNFLILKSISFNLLGNYIVTIINGILIGVFISSILDQRKKNEII